VEEERRGSLAALGRRGDYNRSKDGKPNPPALLCPCSGLLSTLPLINRSSMHSSAARIVGFVRSIIPMLFYCTPAFLWIFMSFGALYVHAISYGTCYCTCDTLPPFLHGNMLMNRC